MSNLLTTLRNSAHFLTVVLSKQEEATKALEGQLPRMMQINKKSVQMFSKVTCMTNCQTTLSLFVSSE